MFCWPIADISREGSSVIEGLLVSQALLWVVVIALSVVCLALARQIGVLYERIAPAGALAMNAKLAGGDTAPTIPLTTLTGETVTLGPDASGIRSRSQLLFFVSPSCPVCKTLLPVLKSVHREKRARVEIVLASDGDHPDTHRRFIEEQ